ncbi:MAG: Gfo/Idh/MocA family oxidoreductase [Kiritimatiellae bacterium]|nr:Gfo/Idh/MocA family oxidoreductase [Kiritimatiellia bacterium]
MKSLRAVLLGYGVRGRVYGEYILAHPEQFSLVAIADPIAKREDVTAFGNAPLFQNWKDALEVEADVAIIALPDLLHKDAAIDALGRGLDILLEKPLGCSLEECDEILAAQKKSGRLVLTGYVLRFSRYYRELAEVLRSRKIGEIMAIRHLVAVGYAKAAHAFCRGNWGKEGDGASELVQKCIHDFDLIEWWLSSRKLIAVSSFGSLNHWKKENAPANSAARCIDCPDDVKKACPFDAEKLYVESDDLRYHFAERNNRAMRKVVDESRYGRCVYACNNDCVDHQSVLMEYEGGLTASLEMENFSNSRRRTTRFFGTKGEIYADGEKIEIMPFGSKSVEIYPMAASSAHGGGDREIMAEFYRLAVKVSPARYTALLEAALESHTVAFLAEVSRKEHRMVVA